MFFKKKTVTKPEPQESPAMTEEEVRDFVGKIPEHAERHREVAKEVFGIALDYSAESILSAGSQNQPGMGG